MVQLPHPGRSKWWKTQPNVCREISSKPCSRLEFLLPSWISRVSLALALALQMGQGRRKNRSIMSATMDVVEMERVLSIVFRVLNIDIDCEHTQWVGCWSAGSMAHIFWLWAADIAGTFPPRQPEDSEVFGSSTKSSNPRSNHAPSSPHHWDLPDHACTRKEAKKAPDHAILNCLNELVNGE